MIIAIIAGVVVTGASLFVGWQNLVSYLTSLMYTPKSAWIAMPVAIGVSALPGIVVATDIMAVGARRARRRKEIGDPLPKMRLHIAGAGRTHMLGMRRANLRIVR